jgi:glycosyltransferase involved in cell wall biosynthesis
LWQLARPYGRYAYYALWPGRRPDYFRAPWRYRTARLGPRALEKLQFSFGDPDRTVFLFLPMVDWHVRFQRSQQLARALATLGHTCIYLNPQLGCEYKAPYLFDSHPRVGVVSEGVLELHVHLPREHESHRRALLRSEALRVVSAIEDVMGISKIGKAVQIVSFPRWLEVSQSLRDRRGLPIIYDCHDYLRGLERVSPGIIGREDALFECSDFVVFSSEYLQATMCARSPSLQHKSRLVRNGCSPADFADPPPRGEKRGKPVVGYAGALESWLDVDLLEYTALNHPDCTFQLLGRVEDRRVLRLKEHPNVELVGEVPYSEVPKYMSNWDAAMIPFIRNTLTDAADVIKLYEYFSAGLPVISTALKQLERFRGLVHVGEDFDGFSSCVGEALAEVGAANRERRLAIARQETWIERAKSLIAISQAAGPLAAGGAAGKMTTI